MSSIKHHVTGQQYWRSLEQLAETPAVADFLDQEFPGYDAETIAGTSRRGFMKLMAAAMALAGITLSGCRRWPKEELAPYASNPRGITPGVPERYATSWEVGGVGASLLVTSFDGRPIKIEGNPDHPASRTAKDADGKFRYGSADGWAQAALLEMYDPARSQYVIDRTQVKDVAREPEGEKHTTWEAFLAVAKPLLAQLKAQAKTNEGAKFAILSEATASSSVADLRTRIEKQFNDKIWYEYEPLTRDNEREGAKLALLKRDGDGKFVGEPLRQILHLEKATVIVSLDADLLGTHPNHIRHANDWAQKRRSADIDKTMSRVYVAESGLSITGAVADERLAVEPSRIYALVYAIAARLKPTALAGIPSRPTIVPIEGEDLSEAELKFVKQAVEDLKTANSNGVVAVGPGAPPEAHALVFAINGALEAIGTTVTYTEELDSQRASHLEAITKLRDDMNSGAVTTLLILGGNPVYDAPADLNFAAALAKVPTSIHLSLYDNETSHASKWHLPRAHFLESWGDTRSWDGVVTLQQPLILPLFGGKSVIELLAMMVGDGVIEGEKIVRRTLSELPTNADDAGAFEKKFRAALERGFYTPPFKVRSDATVLPLDLQAPGKRTSSAAFTLRFEQDSHAYDGRFAGNGWLQETPDPLTKLMWDNALLISVKDGLALGLDTGDMVEITVPYVLPADSEAAAKAATKPAGDGSAQPTTKPTTPKRNGTYKLTVPVCLLPGQPNKVVSLSLGYGRTAAGPIGNELGFNAYTVRTSNDPWFVPDVQIRKTGEKYMLVSSVEHHLLSTMSMEAEQYRVGRKTDKRGKEVDSGKIIRVATLDQYKEDPDDLGGVVRKVALQLFQEPDTDSAGNKGFRDIHAWGMTIDLNACIGCNACALACQAENNIPIVGKAQCYRHREMNWIRIDRYFKFENKADGTPNIEDETPDVVFQPMTCQHCENAPCEQVCPVAATVHDSEGLNTMVYNRCIGTRYCSNNCPYKVRRFNYFDYHAQDPRFGNEWLKMPWLNIPDAQQLDPKLVDPIKRMVFNPQVTVRMRGVMEKCTYCVQRIHTTVTAKRTHHNEDIVDGDIITACQQACPTEAIVFGNLNDPKAQVSKLQKNPRAYDVLHDELNTRPRTRYLAQLKNPAEEKKA